MMTTGDPEGQIFLGHGKISDGDPRSVCKNACAWRNNLQEATVSGFFFQIYPYMSSINNVYRIDKNS